MKLSRLNVTPPADIVQTGPVCTLCILDLSELCLPGVYGLAIPELEINLG